MPRRIAQPVTDENYPSTLSRAAKRPTLLAESGSIGRLARVPAMGGAGISGGRERVYRSGRTAAFHQDHVGIIPPGRAGSNWLPAAGRENSAIWQSARKFRSWRTAVFRDSDADTRERDPAGGQIKRWPADQN